ncbi:MAG: radical SAM protein [Candidatus Bathyarchaeota archaeon]|nr:radical SAM protein [Candidatus Bathyarchaeota archaeon]
MNETNIYHVIFFTKRRVLGLLFKNCNFNCLGCINKLSPWSPSLSKNVQEKLKNRPLKTLSLEEFKQILPQFSDSKVVLLSGQEPTLDPNLPKIIEVLNHHGLGTILETNAYCLDENKIKSLEVAGLDEVRVSIKAYNDEIYKYYTGKSNKEVLKNFRFLWGSAIIPRATTVLIPGLIDKDEVRNIAEFVSSVDEGIMFTVIGYVAVPSAPWRSASVDEVIEAVNISRRYLRNVWWVHNEVQVDEEVLCIYPELT